MTERTSETPEDVTKLSRREFMKTGSALLGASGMSDVTDATGLSSPVDFKGAYIGPDADKAGLGAKGWLYFADDTGARYKHTGSGWELLDLEAKSINAERVSYDTSEMNPVVPRQPQADAPLTVRPHSNHSNPVLTGSDVTDFSADYVADPFVVPHNGVLHMFFEVKDTSTSDTAIAHATSFDGLNWTYDEVVLTSSTHLAFPQVFKWGSDWYMVPDRGNDTDRVDIFKADSFPDNWSLVDQGIITGNGLIDPAIANWNGTWYIFVSKRATTDELRLYYADSLVGGNWTEHSASPLYTGQRNTQAAGRPVVHENYIDLYLQDRQRSYGDKVRHYRVTHLSKSTYNAHEVPSSPVIQSHRNGQWNDNAMHHVERVMHDAGGKELVFVDGRDSSDLWSIGVYEVGPTLNVSKLAKGSSQSISSGSYQKVALDTINHDSMDALDTANGEFVAPESGYYELSAAVGYQLQSTGTPHQLNARLYNETKSSEIVVDISPATNSTTMRARTGKVVEWLDKGDRVSLYAYQDSGGSRDIPGNTSLTYIDVEML